MTTNLTEHPAMSITNGLDKIDHLASVTLLENLYDESSLLETAYIFQSATPFDQKHPERFMFKTE